MKLTYYNIAGYKNKIDYETTEKRTGYDYKLINKIATGNFKGRNNRYLLTETYTDLLVNKLNFHDEHEMLWGDDDEIQVYSTQIFECLIRDCINADVDFKDNILSLLSNFRNESSKVTQEKIDRLLEMRFDNKITVKDQFIRLFTDFTYNKLSSENYETDEGVFQITSEIEQVTKFNDNTCLTFKKLPESIERFVQNEFSSFLMNIFLRQLTND